jgi:nucleotide-binding universal stress UspA family protein
VDRHDHVIADEEREMARLSATAEAWTAQPDWEATGVPVERVVRFGRLAEEVVTEVQAWHADLIGLTAPVRPGLRHRLRAWSLRRAAAIPGVLLPMPADVDRGGHRDPLVLPAFR